MHVELSPRIAADPDIQDGKPFIKGTQVPVGAVLASLATGESMADVARELDIAVEDVKAALAYAADQMQQPVIAEDALFKLDGIIASDEPGWADDHDRYFG